MGAAIPWRSAMAAALYGSDGFYTRAPGQGRAGSTGPGSAQFRTSANSLPAFADALLHVVHAVDGALGHPDPLTLVDVGAGGGELLSRLAGRAAPALQERLRPVAVELARRPPDLSAWIGWSPALPPGVTGVVLATEWLDNVPLDVAEVGPDGGLWTVRVDPATGDEIAGDAPDRTDAAWAAQWWSPRSSTAGDRVEFGGPRDAAWASVVSTMERGVALTVDYGHTRESRPALGTLTGFAGGRQVPPVPDGSCDLTAHVAMDSVRAAGEARAGRAAVLTTQRKALTALGITGRRPPRDLAERDPAGYLRALAAASQAAELTDHSGLGDHLWLIQPVGMALPADLARLAGSAA